MEMPACFVSIGEILDLQMRRNGLLKEIKPYQLVSICGVVTDRREAVPTSKEDWKATVRLVDLSKDQEGKDATIELHVFFPEKDMQMLPKARCGDVMMLQNVKVQSRMGDVSLITSKYSSKFALYQASKIPKPPASAAAAVVPFPPQFQRSLDLKDSLYAAYVRQNVSENSVPQEEEFILMNAQSSKVKEKAKDLKDLTPESFADLTVEVVRPPFEGGMCTTLYVTDYTTNAEFYNFPEPELQSDSTPCPKGQMTMQMSCFDEHMTHIQEAGIAKGTWVFMRNVRIRYGHQNNNIEGFLRGDKGDKRNAGKPIKITILRMEDKDDLTPRHRKALERKRDYLRAEKTKHQAVEEAAAAGQKRKASKEPTEGNAKAKRRARRQIEKEKAQKGQHNLSTQQTATEPAAEDELAFQPTSSPGRGRKGADANQPTPNLNPSIKCEKTSTAPSTVEHVQQIFSAMFEVAPGTKESLALPFVNRKYRMDVRVTDFYPPNLADFAHRKRIKPQHDGLDLLSNDGGSVLSGGDSDPEAEETDYWEWRFWLRLEDATPGTPKQSFWALVDNHAAQCLLNLDAGDLSSNQHILDKFREHMSILWGDLEEQKRIAAAEALKPKANGPKEAPPPHSDDEDDDAGSKVSNRPFPCCIEQYGVKLKESDPDKANAGESRRWQRMFRVFGTRIAYRVP